MKYIQKYHNTTKLNICSGLKVQLCFEMLLHFKATKEQAFHHFIALFIFSEIACIALDISQI